ncbi:MAG: GNAT family N-acetyltransferase [Bacteroidia bacterium]|nr:GNAT family N-acetyltransferase [Bacteroidia bacterium]MBL4716834.1 GNAT family N-acetyltransferase [Bacteroidia bacterium]
MLNIIQVKTEQQLSDTKSLLMEYGSMRHNDVALGDYHNELETLPGKYAPPDGYLLIAYYEDAPAGCVAYRKIEEHICEMKRLYVNMEYLGNKIGKQLVDELIKIAKQNGYSLMRLDTHPWMKNANELYQKFGFMEIDAYHFNPTKGIKYYELELT